MIYLMWTTRGVNKERRFLNKRLDHAVRLYRRVAKTASAIDLMEFTGDELKATYSVGPRRVTRHWEDG